MNSTLFQSITDTATLGIMAINSKTNKIIYLNARARELLEVEPEKNLKELGLEYFMCEGYEAFPCFSKSMINKKSFNGDAWMKCATGSIFVAHLRIQRTVTKTGSYVVLMFEDATFEKKLEREIRTKQENLESTYTEVVLQNEALKNIDKIKDNFMALTTHELRTPLAAIVATLDMVNMKMYDSEEQLNKFISTITAEAEHLVVIVNDILDLAKIQAGKMDFYISEGPLKELILAKVTHFESMATSNKVEIYFDSKDKDIDAYFDDLRLGQVLANVINNAIKFNRQGGRVDVTVSSTVEKARIEIKDTGKGIPREKFSRIFNEFETVQEMDSHHRGTGLGMPISKKLMEAMGGKIFFESEVGVGTTFYIEVPRKKVLSENMYGTREQLAADIPLGA